jgi:hypothetical protein
MRTLVAALALIALAGCGGDSSTARTTGSLVGTWTLQTYNGKPLPFTGTVNDNGSVDRVDGGTIAFDSSHSYVLGIKIVNTLGSTVIQQNYNEVGSYSGTTLTGVTLKPNDLSGGKDTTGNYTTVPATIANNTLSFSQQGKVLTFSK